MKKISMCILEGIENESHIDMMHLTPPYFEKQETYQQNV